MQIRKRIITPAIREAERLLDATMPLMKGAPPVNLGKICEHLGIDVYTAPCDSFGAILVRSADKVCILANDKQQPGRFRFSIAHEIGHLTLNHTPLRNPTEARNAQVEREADEFAAELLLPERFLSQEPEQALRDMPELAKRYRVSRQALTIRLGELAAAS